MNEFNALRLWAVAHIATRALAIAEDGSIRYFREKVAAKQARDELGKGCWKVTKGPDHSKFLTDAQRARLVLNKKSAAAKEAGRATRRARRAA